MPEVERTIVLGMSPKQAEIVRTACQFTSTRIELLAEDKYSDEELTELDGMLAAVVAELDAQLALPRKVKAE